MKFLTSSVRARAILESSKITYKIETLITVFCTKNTYFYILEENALFFFIHFELLLLVIVNGSFEPAAVKAGNETCV